MGQFAEPHTTSLKGMSSNPKPASRLFEGLGLVIDYKSSAGPTLGEESVAFNLSITSANGLNIQVFSDKEPTHCLYREEDYTKASFVIEVTNHYQLL